MAETQPKMTLGVAVGRFQTPNLTEGHRALINRARSHARTLVVIGVNPILGTRKNPLPAFALAQMIQSEFPGVYQITLPDTPSDETWSRNLDARIAELFPLTSAMIYTGPDGIAKSYTGKFPVEVVPHIEGLRASAIRKRLLERSSLSSDFRSGIIYATQQVPPVTRLAVDIGMTSNLTGMGPGVALIRKNSENLWRFPGGIVDRAESLEEAAIRELKEELGGQGVSFADPEYVASGAIADWRLRGQEESAVSALFWARHLMGPIKAGDDAHHSAWFTIKTQDARDDTRAMIMPEHRTFFDQLTDFVLKNKERTGLRF